MAIDEPSGTAPPVVIFGCAPLVVGLHAVLDYARAFAARVGAELLRGTRPSDARLAGGRPFGAGALAGLARGGGPPPLRGHARRLRGGSRGSPPCRSGVRRRSDRIAQGTGAPP